MASVATPLAGLPNHQMSPPDMHNFTATDFSDHMRLDHSTSPNHDRDTEQDSPTSPEIEDDEQERSRAVGNLLAALSRPNNATQQLPVPDAMQQDIVGLQDQDLPEQTDLDLQAIVENAQLPELSAPTLDVPALTNHDFPYFAQHEGSLPITQEHDIPQNFIHTEVYAQPEDQIMTEPEPITPAPTRREYEAFARLVFPDGNFYLNTYSCELGRDVLAYKAAIERQAEEKAVEERALAEGRPRSSNARSRNPSERLRREVGSQVQGSIVSEAGGFAGIDEKVDASGVKLSADGEPLPSSADSQSSGVIRPQDIFKNPVLIPFDYKRSTDALARHDAMQRGEIPEDNEEPAAVTSDHLPNPNFCPLIPIHGNMQSDKSEIEAHRNISRRHVKIYWNFERDQWEIKALGRNGLFLNDQFYEVHSVMKLEDNAVIQVSNVQLTFKLPTPKQNTPPPDTPDIEDDEGISEITQNDEILPSIEQHPAETSVENNKGKRRESTVESQTGRRASVNNKQPPAPNQTIVGPDGQVVQKRRGPGRPPKDGIMSTRERKELEKAKKAAEAKAANGGKTPPPSMIRGKPNPKPTPVAVEEVEKDDPKGEKRKYKKRKRLDENGNIIPSADGEDSESSEDDRAAKKARTQREKSLSPEYPAKETLTAEQLQRPTESYAVLLYNMLSEIYPAALPLKQIYRKMKQTWPFFVHCVGTEGWQSSVRHNLNSEVEKLFTKGDKEGKGFAWRAVPGRTPAQQDKKKSVTQGPPKPRMMPPNAQFQQVPGTQQPWPAQAGFPPNGQQFVGQGPWQGQGPPPGHQPQVMAPPGQAGTILPMQPPPGGPQAAAGNLPNVPQQTLPGQQQSSNATQASMAPPANPQARNGNQAQPIIPLGYRRPTIAPVTMPCTLWGIEAVHRFQDEIFKVIGDTQPQRSKWDVIWNSAKRRCLYGFPESQNDEGDTHEEHVLMTHINKFVEKFRNPNYRLSIHDKQRYEAEGIPIPDATVPLEHPVPLPSALQIHRIEPPSLPRSPLLESIRTQKKAEQQAAEAAEQAEQSVATEGEQSAAAEGARSTGEGQQSGPENGVQVASGNEGQQVVAEETTDQSNQVNASAVAADVIPTQAENASA